MANKEVRKDGIESSHELAKKLYFFRFLSPNKIESTTIAANMSGVTSGVMSYNKCLSELLNGSTITTSGCVKFSLLV